MLKSIKKIRKLAIYLFVLIAFTSLTSCNNKSLNASANNMHINSNKRQVFKWGTSKKEVIKNKSNKNCIKEKHSLLYENEVLPYIKGVSGYLCEILYQFEKDKLIGEMYFMTAEKDSVDFINDYNAIKEALSQQYGEPYEEKENWKESSDKESGLSLEDAILEGKMNLGSGWLVDDDTVAKLNLSCVNDTLFFTIGYKPMAQK